MRNGSQQLGFVIVTHGSFGKEMLKVAQYIMGGRLEAFQAVEVPFISEMDQQLPPDSQTPFNDRKIWLAQKISEAIKTVNQGAGVIVLTDIIGGTSFNVSRQLVDPGCGAVIAGVNLPMLLKAASLTGLKAGEAADALVARSRKAIDSIEPKES